MTNCALRSQGSEMLPCGKSISPGTYKNEGSSDCSATSPGLMSCGTGCTSMRASSSAIDPSRKDKPELVVQKSIQIIYFVSKILSTQNSIRESQPLPEPLPSGLCRRGVAAD